MNSESNNCLVCGCSFIKKRKNATCCSRDCAYRKEKLREFERRKERRISDPEFLERERAQNAALRLRHKDKERERISIWRESNPDKVLEYRIRYRKNMPAHKKRERKRRYREYHPEASVREYLRKQLDSTPPPELVEEATALRLLRRAIKQSED